MFFTFAIAKRTVLLLHLSKSTATKKTPATACFFERSAMKANWGSQG
jgi:hypothetical protein